MLVGKDAALKTETCSSPRLTLLVEQAYSRAGAGCVGWRRLREVVASPGDSVARCSVREVSPTPSSCYRGACNKPAPVGSHRGGERCPCPCML